MKIVNFTLAECYANHIGNVPPNSIYFITWWFICRFQWNGGLLFIKITCLFNFTRFKVYWLKINSKLGITFQQNPPWNNCNTYYYSVSVFPISEKIKLAFDKF